MLEKLTDVPAGVDALRAVGTVSKHDYETVFKPLVDQARGVGRRLRLLYQVGPEFEGFTPGAAWEDARIGLSSLRLLDGCAVVSDIGWIRESTRLVGFWMPCPVRVFCNHERDEALAWLGGLPEGTGVTHRLVAESGVIEVEVTRPLRVQDFDALALTADTWLDAHETLRGIVIHAREFPGWENVAGLVRHIRFVRDHHRKVRRVALVADSKLATLAPHLVEHFVRAEVKNFGYDELDEALAWAAA
ncbi:MAG: STAS/SEC14 domain-containing protein [Actinomycetota bacterium]|nr:STAS/SEC14 domain-containing protein [Actinomycetota bacterium]